jgi:hypothetical protein
VIREVTEHCQHACPYAEETAKQAVEDFYGCIMAMRIAHQNGLKKSVLWGASSIERELRSKGALTAMLFGMYAEQELIFKYLQDIGAMPKKPRAAVPLVVKGEKNEVGAGALLH